MEEENCTAQPSLGAGAGLHGLRALGACVQVPWGGLRWALAVLGKSSAQLKFQQAFGAGGLFSGEAVILSHLVTSKVCILGSYLYLLPYLLLVHYLACEFFGQQNASNSIRDTEVPPASWEGNDLQSEARHWQVPSGSW